MNGVIVMSRRSKKIGRPGLGPAIIKSFLAKGSNGCQFYRDCWTCPLPACICDGYDPRYKVKKNAPPKQWTSEETEHLRELRRLPGRALETEVLANIFRTSVEEIIQKEYRLFMEGIKNGSSLQM